MYKYLIALICLSLVGCASKTQYGNCVGFWDKEEPKLEYELSKRNIIISAIFFESVFVPVWVALQEVKCPTGEKK